MHEEELRLHRCCFTGHRPEKLHISSEEAQAWLGKRVKEAINDGFTTFITGMAMGVDIWAGQIVVRFRQKNPALHLIAVVPHPTFSSRWNEEWKQAYNNLLKEADLVRCINDHFDMSNFQKRNIWMVDHSSRVIALYNGEPGGTKNTIVYANSIGVPVIEYISG